MPRPTVIVSAGKTLFASFFPTKQQRRMRGLFRWQLIEATTLTADFKRRLSDAEALITTWDTPKLGEDLQR